MLLDEQASPHPEIGLPSSLELRSEAGEIVESRLWRGDMTCGVPFGAGAMWTRMGLKWFVGLTSTRVGCLDRTGSLGVVGEVR